MRIKIIFCLMVAALLLSACGKKGPVRPLPQPPTEIQKPLAEESEKKPK